MTTVYDGTKRSMTVEVVWTVSGTIVSDKIYNGKTGSIYDNLNDQIIAAGGSGFTWNMVTYPNLTGTQFAQLDEAVYQARLAAFKLWVESLEPGYTFNANLDPSFPPTAIDEVECPPFIIGTTTTTTTVITVTTTGTTTLTTTTTVTTDTTDTTTSSTTTTGTTDTTTSSTTTETTTTTTETTTTTTIACMLIDYNDAGGYLWYSPVSAYDACYNGVGDPYYGDEDNIAFCTKVYSDIGCETLAPAGFYATADFGLGECYYISAPGVQPIPIGACEGTDTTTTTTTLP